MCVEHILVRERERIVARDFAGLAERAQRSWDSDAQAANAAATLAFEAEARAREALGAQLASARAAKKLLEPALSEKSGVQQAEISRIERGLAEPHSDHARATCPRPGPATRVHAGPLSWQGQRPQAQAR